MTLTHCITYTPYLIVAGLLFVWLIIKGYDEWDHSDTEQKDPEDYRDGL